MKNNTFLKFFLYTTGCMLILGIFLLIYSKLFQLQITKLYLVLYIGAWLYFGLGFGIFGHIYAKNTTLTINNPHNSIEGIGNMLDKSKYQKLKDTNSELVFSSNKYREWFYGKIYIKNYNNKITINAAKCIINKYFKEAN